MIRDKDLASVQAIIQDVDTARFPVARFYRGKLAFANGQWQACIDHLNEYFADAGRTPGPAALKMYKQAVEHLTDQQNRLTKPAAAKPITAKAARVRSRAIVARIAEALAKDDLDTAAREAQQLDRYGEFLERANWADDVVWAKAAHFYFADDKRAAAANFLERTLEVSVDYGYLTWPRRIQSHIRGKSVLDVGCAFGGFGSGFLAAGARRYTGLDPVMDLDSTQAKNKRLRAAADLPTTPRQIMEQAPDIELIQGKSEDIRLGTAFDAISLHNVTEHLIQIEAVFDGLVPLCHSETEIIFNHHNYFCWNGHHQHPKSFDAYRPDNPDHQKFDRWLHVDAAYGEPDGGYLFTHLNRIRLDAFYRMLERNFRIVAWQERPSPAAVQALLTPEILERVQKIDPSLSERDLTVNTVFGIVKLK